MKNINLFGDEVDIPDPPRGRKKTPTMQEMFGVTEGRTCGECVHCYGYSQSRTWYKCSLWLKLCFRGKHSAASDIRLKNPACGKFVKDEDGE